MITCCESEIYELNVSEHVKLYIDITKEFRDDSKGNLFISGKTKKSRNQKYCQMAEGCPQTFWH